MTNQEMFDLVSYHLLTQNQQATSNGSCRYHGPNGLKCAIGCLIPDNLYSPEMENKSVHFLLDKFPSIRQYISNHELVRELQAIHDEGSPSYWAARLEAIAKDWNLTFTPPNATLVS